MENEIGINKRGDISDACRRVGVSTTVYYNSTKILREEWTAGMWDVHVELKKIRDERKQFVAAETE